MPLGWAPCWGGELPPPGAGPPPLLLGRAAWICTGPPAPHSLTAGSLQSTTKCEIRHHVHVCMHARGQERGCLTLRSCKVDCAGSEWTLWREGESKIKAILPTEINKSSWKYLSASYDIILMIQTLRQDKIQLIHFYCFIKLNTCNNKLLGILLWFYFASNSTELLPYASLKNVSRPDMKKFSQNSPAIHFTHNSFTSVEKCCVCMLCLHFLL